MTVLQWDNVGERRYETGVDRGVLYQIDIATGEYVDGVAWNGLTTVTESPSGAESNKQYADNIVYVNLVSAEEFGGTIEAFTYPDEFGQNDGSAEPVAGVSLGQQGRRPFGLAYRTLMGNDTQGTEFGYKLHLVYGCQASPSEKAYATVNDSPEAASLSWEFTTTPINVTGRKATSIVTIDSTKTDPDALAALEDILFGTADDEPRLPTPDEVIALVGEGAVNVDLAVAASQPTFVEGTGVITLPAVTGVQWKVGGVNKAPGAQPPLAAGASATVRATAQPGFNLVGDETWQFRRPA
jgi:hypothetical protein